MNFVLQNSISHKYIKYKGLKPYNLTGMNLTYKLPPYTLAGFDLMAHRSSLLCGRLRRYHCIPGLPDGIFSNQKPNLGKFWKVLELKR
jgi:hypothetical protein